MKLTLILLVLTLNVICQDLDSNSVPNVSLLFDDDMNLDNLGSDGFLQKKSKNSQNNVEDLPGYINPNANLNNNNSPTSFRFSQQKPKDDNPSFQPYFYNPGNPQKDSEIIRKEGLSNGVVLHRGKRTLNFETGKYPQYFMDLRVEK